MGWSGWPAGSGTDITSYDFLIQPWWALQEKWACVGQGYDWPKTAIVWASGIVTSVSDNGEGSLFLGVNNTDGWPTDTECCTGGFENRVCTGGGSCYCPPTYLPQRYDLVVNYDSRDTRTQVRGMITAASTESSSLTIQSTGPINSVTAGFIPGLSALVGKKFVVVKHNGPYILDRLPEKPNDPEQWIGSMSADEGYWPGDDITNPLTGEVTHTGPLYTILTDADPDNSPGWSTDQWAGTYEIMAFVGSRAVRPPIIHNDDKTIYVEHLEAAPTGDYAIVLPTDKTLVGRKVWKPHQWYYGKPGYSAGHGFEDNIVAATGADGSDPWAEGNPCVGFPCEEEPHTVMDLDIQRPWDSNAQCIGSTAGDFSNPNIWKSLRQIQNGILEVAPNFIPRNYSGGDREPKSLTPAWLFTHCSINAGTSTVVWQPTGEDEWGNPKGYYYFTASDYIGKAVWWTTLNHLEANDMSGYGAVGISASPGVTGYPDRVQVGYPYPPPTDVTPTPENSPVGRQVKYSAGWTRHRPRWFKHLYSKTSFMPDFNQDTGPFDPPAIALDDNGHYDCAGRGTWIKRFKSSGAAIATDGGAVLDSAEEFVTGELYRLVGDNMADFPGVGFDDDLLAYKDKFYRGKLSDDNQSARNASRKGTVTAGTKYSLTDSSKNWWADWANGGGVLRVESGTATGGGTTFLEDDSKDTTDPEQPHGCWWDAIRYPNYERGAFNDFILEVDHTENEGGEVGSGQGAAVTTTTKVPITTTTNGAGGIVINFASVDGFAVNEGDEYRTKEPKYEVNKWEGRNVKITKPDGSVVTVAVSHSDEDSLYFAPQSSPIPADSKYEILEDGFGGVYKWTGSAMVLATGEDVARIGVSEPVDFLDDATANLQGWVIDYGHIHYGDCMVATVLYKEIYDTLYFLKTTKHGCSWTNRPDINLSETDPPDNERNFKVDAGYGGAWDTAHLNDGVAQWHHFGHPCSNPSVPYRIGEPDLPYSFDEAWTRMWAFAAKPPFPYAYPTQEYFDFVESCRCNEDGSYFYQDPEGCDNSGCREAYTQSPYYGVTYSYAYPPRQFGNASIYAFYYKDPNGQDQNQAGNRGLGIGMGLSSCYSYPYTDNYSMRLPGTAKFFVFTGITDANPAEGVTSESHSTEQAPYYGAFDDSHYWQENIFSGLGQPVQYRKWSFVSTGTLDSRGKTQGVKVGDTRAVDRPANPFRPKYGDYTAVGGDYSSIGGPNTDGFNPPYGFGDYDFNCDGVLERYGPFKSQNQQLTFGYCVLNQLTVIDWQMEFA